LLRHVPELNQPLFSFFSEYPAVPLHPTPFGAAAVGDALAGFIGPAGARR